MRRPIFYLISILCPLLISCNAVAKNIELYDEPKDNAKKVGVIESSNGIIPIFTPEKSSWMKVADPRNGNVGWVKMNDINNEKSTEYTFTQRLINTGNTPQTYQVIQFGSPRKLASDQIREMLKKQQTEQQLQENINRSMQKMLNEMSNLYHWNSTWLNDDLPFIMPVIVIPRQAIPEAADHKKSVQKND